MDSNKGRFIKGIELVAIVIGLTASIYGLVIAKDALNEYKKDNRLSALIKQDEKEAMLYNPGSGLKTENLMISNCYKHFFCDYTPSVTSDFTEAERYETVRFFPGDSWCSVEA